MTDEQPQEEHGPKVKVPPPIVGLLVLGGGFGLEWVVPLAVPLSAVVRGVGGVLAAAGVFLMVWSIRTILGTGQDPEPWKPVPELITSGPFQFSRNPVYVGLAMILLGVSLASATLWIAILVPVFVFVLNHFVIVREEAYLEQRFAGRYTEYRDGVRRWL